jgi:hypothetical protein
MEFVEQSCVRHASYTGNELAVGNRICISQSGFDDTTADYWRYSRMYSKSPWIQQPKGRLFIGVG